MATEDTEIELKREAVEADEVGLLDVLVLVVEHWKLLIAGSLLMGALAAGLAHFAPKTYVSEAILALPAAPPPGQRSAASLGGKVQTAQQAAALMVAPQVLDPVVQQFKLAEGVPAGDARKRLKSQIKAEVDLDGLLRLQVGLSSPDLAQAVANTIIDQWMASTVPTEQERAELERTLKLAESSLTATQQLISRLATENTDELAKPLTRGEAGVSIVAVGELQSRYLEQVLETARLLRGYTRDVVKQPPTLPSVPESANKGLIGLLTALATATFLLLWIFVVQAWRSAAQDPRAASKLLRLRSALGLK